MDIALIFSKPVPPSFARMFCKSFGSRSCKIKAIYMNDWIFSMRTDEFEDDKHCFDYAKYNNFISIYITIL